ncbi:hypothetical protein AB4Y86_17185 [Arthrobacter sp. 2YAF22_2]|uniref:hypothetical protein n=1 Tax=Arthrobacter sp. 2YAF22_2 TaxID=3233029 RepID=UPI003F90951D
MNHGSSLAEADAEPWLPTPAGWGSRAVDLQEQDSDSVLNLARAALALRWKLRKNEVFTADDGGTWHVEAGNLLVCERSENFLVAVAIGSEPVRLPSGTVVLSASPLRG